MIFRLLIYISMKLLYCKSSLIKNFKVLNYKSKKLDFINEISH